MRSRNWSPPALTEDWQAGGFGLYVHWPFCQSKCPYCDFNSHVTASVDHERWRRALVSEVRRVGAETPGRVLNSIFFGGGTPSLMEPETVSAIIEAAVDVWTPANDIEITLEANPGSVEAGRFAAFRDGGVNRVSMGIQALNDADLKALGRLHSVAEARAAFDIARREFDRVSFDLIYARQHQTLDDWRAELNEALEMAVDHLSAYQLTIEDGTAFGDRFRRGGLRGLPSEDLGADMYFATQEICDKAGMRAYEVSNHARNGAESQHNLIYWNAGDYAGVGPGAHGRLTLKGSRYATEAPLGPMAWLEAVEKRGSGEKDRSALSADDQALEYLLMGLRVAQGIDLARYGRMGGPALDKDVIDDLADSQFVEQDKDILRVTPNGRPLLNAILRELAP